MRKYFLILFVFLFTYSTFCQNQKKVVGDTTYWLAIQKDLYQKLDMDNLISSDNKFHFRYWEYGLFVDLLENDSNNLNGLITNYIIKYEYDKKSDNYIQKHSISRKTVIDTVQSAKLFHLIQRSHLQNIPTDNEIKNWGFGKDGITYIFQIVDDDSLSFKTFWEPADQPDSVYQAKEIRTFIEKMYDILKLQELQESFQNNLAPGLYTVGNQFMKIVR